MRAMIYKVIYLFFIFTLMQDDDKVDVDKKRLELFKEKVKVFCEDCPGVLARKEMPNSLENERKNQHKMPITQIEGFMEHRKSGLRYYPNEAVLVDTSTKFSYDLNSYVIIDLENSKVLGSKAPICTSATDSVNENTPAATKL